MICHFILVVTTRAMKPPLDIWQLFSFKQKLNALSPVLSFSSTIVAVTGFPLQTLFAEAYPFLGLYSTQGDRVVSCRALHHVHVVCQSL